VFAAIVRRPQLNPIRLSRILDTPEHPISANWFKEQAGRYGSPQTREEGDAVGLFVEREANATSIEAALARAYEAPERSTAEAKQVAAAEAPVLAQNAAAAKKHYKLGRIVFAVIFFLLLLAIAIAAEALDWVEDPAKIYDFAGLVLAVVIGYIGGESAS
jgi:hypothetical protein